MPQFNWKKIALVAADIALAAYLFLAVTAFNNPDDQSAVCTKVDIAIEDAVVEGFLGENEIKAQLKKSHIFPQGQPMKEVDVRKIEETLLGNPFVDRVQCYKTQGGHVRIVIAQRLPVMRVKAANGDDYYIDSSGAVMPNTRYASNLVVATGEVSRLYAQRTLARIGNMLLQDNFWKSQVEQLNVLPDGSLEMVPRVGNHIVFLGEPVNLNKKLERLKQFYIHGLSVAGWNKYRYINVEFDNQIICKKR